MSSLLSQLCALQGLSAENTSKNSKLGKFFGGEPVSSSKDLARIQALPRRTWDADPEPLSVHLRCPGSKATLFRMQAAVLTELYELQRCSCVAALGTGKTLVTALAPTVLGVRRAAFLNYSRLMDKTKREFEELSNSWKVFRKYDFLTVERLSLDKYATWFDDYVPELVVVDEAQSLADPNGARFRRLRRYKESRPSTIFLILTGTPGEELEKYWHLQALLHGEESPLPLDEYVVQEWSEAVGSKVRGQRRALGALTVFGADLSAVREGIGKRVEETAGNIYHRIPDGVHCGLYHGSVTPSVSVRMDELCDAARDNLELPDGRSYEELYDTSLILKQLGCGFAKVLDPAPPAPWREARSLIGSFVREIIRQEDKYRFDTPLQVVKAIRSGELDDGGLFEAWKAIEPSFTPQHVTEWFDDSIIEWCAKWLTENNGLVWTTLPTFGRRLAETARAPFFHALGVDPIAGSIETYSAGPAILSLSANCLGRNLQDRWSKNLFVTPPSSATNLDQAIGRTVRTGQRAATVEVTYLFTVRENYESVMRARAGAELDRSLGRNQASRLLLGDWCVSDPGNSGPRWRKM